MLYERGLRSNKMLLAQSVKGMSPESMPVKERRNGRTDGRTDERTNEQTDARTNERSN